MHGEYKLNRDSTFGFRPRSPVPSSLAGFTLLEVLVVVLIIGITMSFAVLTIGGREDPAKQEARRVLELLKLAREESVLRGKEIGLQVDRDSYTFLVLRDNKWQPMEDDSLFRRRELPEDVRVELEAEGEDIGLGKDEDEEEKTADEVKKDAHRPQAFMLSSGEVSPFSLTFQTDNGGEYRVEAKETGKFEFLTLDDDAAGGWD